MGFVTRETIEAGQQLDRCAFTDPRLSLRKTAPMVPNRLINNDLLNRIYLLEVDMKLFAFADEERRRSFVHQLS